MFRVYSTVVAVVATCCLCSADSSWQYEFEQTPLGEKVDLASMKMLKAAYESSDDKNVVTSPLAVQVLLTRPPYWYSFGAKVRPDTEIAVAFGGKEYDEVSNDYGKLFDSFATIDPKSLSLENAVFVPLNFKPPVITIDGANNSPQAASARAPVPAPAPAADAKKPRVSTEKIDFRDPAVATKAINDWVSARTSGLIEAALGNKALNNESNSAFVNEMFFQAKWNAPCNKTEKEITVDASTTVKQPVIQFKQPLKYRENSELGAKLVEIPLVENGSRVVIVLPKDANSLPSLLEKFAQTGLLKTFASSANDKEINLELPNFNIQREFNLNELLPKVGISAILTGFKFTYVNEAEVYLAQFFQKVAIKVDETGISAGTSSGITPVETGAWSYGWDGSQIKFDLPFLYALLRDDKIVFAGTYTNNHY